MHACLRRGCERTYLPSAIGAQVFEQRVNRLAVTVARERARPLFHLMAVIVHCRVQLYLKIRLGDGERLLHFCSPHAIKDGIREEGACARTKRVKRRRERERHFVGESGLCGLCIMLAYASSLLLFGAGAFKFRELVFGREALVL